MLNPATSPKVIRSPAEYFGAPLSQLTEEAVVLLRLLGHSFQRPINALAGEVADTELIRFLRQADDQSIKSQLAIPFVSLLSTLFFENAPDPLVSATGQSYRDFVPADESQRFALGVRLLRILDAAQIEIAQLGEMIESLFGVPSLSADKLEFYWLLVLKGMRQGVCNPADLLISSRLASDPRFLEGPAFDVAKQDPLTFFRKVIRSLSDAIQDGDAALRGSEATIEALVRVAFDELGRRGTDETALLKDLQTHLNVLCRQDPRQWLAETILRGAIQARIPFERVAKLERGISAGRYISADRRARAARGNVEHVLKSKLDHLSDLAKNAHIDALDPEFVTNSIPYSESIFFNVWADLLNKATKFEVRFLDMKWEAVPDELDHGRLSFAIWNDFFQVNRTKRRKQSIHISTKHPLSVYKTYHVLARRDRIEELVARSRFEDPLLQQLRSVLIEGKPVSGAIGDPSNPFLNLRDLAEAVTADKISFVGKSDIERAARQFFHRAALKEDRVESQPTDQAIEQLIDGKIAVAVVGGVQSQYVRRSWSDKVIVLGTVPAETDVRLYFRAGGTFKRNYKPILPLFAETWNLVKHVWQRARDARAPEDYPLVHWLEEFVHRFNQTEAMRTPILDVGEAFSLADEHDKLCYATAEFSEIATAEKKSKVRNRTPKKRGKPEADSEIHKRAQMKSQHRKKKRVELVWSNKKLTS